MLHVELGLKIRKLLLEVLVDQLRESDSQRSVCLDVGRQRTILAFAEERVLRNIASLNGIVRRVLRPVNGQQYVVQKMGETSPILQHVPSKVEEDVLVLGKTDPGRFVGRV